MHLSEFNSSSIIEKSVARTDSFCHERLYFMKKLPLCSLLNSALLANVHLTITRPTAYCIYVSLLPVTEAQPCHITTLSDRTFYTSQEIKSEQFTILLEYYCWEQETKKKNLLQKMSVPTLS